MILPVMALALLLVSAPAAAQLAASLAVSSDYRVRGLSMNGGRPAAAAGLSFDHGSGLFGEAVVAAGDSRRFGFEYFGHAAQIGVARRLNSRLALDAGVAHTRLVSRVERAFSGDYPEIFAGISHERAALRLYYSPAYLSAGAGALYVDLNANLPVSRAVQIAAHAGWLTPVSRQRGAFLPDARVDLSLMAQARLRRFDLRAGVVHSGAGAAYLGPRGQDATVLLLGAAVHF